MYKHLVIFLIIVLLCSCSRGTENTTITIKEVNVEPVLFYRDNPEDVSFSWSLENFSCFSGEYYLDVYLSRDNTLDRNKDFLLFSILSNKIEDSLVLDPSEFSDVYGGRYYIIFDFYCDANSHKTKIFYPFTIKTEWTFMVYMDGDNSLSSYTDYDLNEMEQIGSSEKVNIVVQVDTLYDPVKRYFVEPGEKVLLGNLGELNMGDGETLVNFGNWVVENFPADHYVLVLWNHGGGFKRSVRGITLKDIAYDETSGDDAITIPELKNALSLISQNLGRKIDIIGMDACLMAMTEVAYEIRDYANYMVASENTEPGNGWPYDTILQVLVTNPDISPEVFAKEIVDKFIQSYPSSDYEATESAINLAQIGNLTSSINSLAQSLINALNNDINGTIKLALQNNIFSQVQRFDDEDEYGITLNDTFVDLYHLAYLIKENIPSLSSEALSVLKAVNATVIASENTGASVSNAYGLSIWFPDSYKYQEYINYYKTLSFSNATSWDEFLEKLWE